MKQCWIIMWDISPSQYTPRIQSEKLNIINFLLFCFLQAADMSIAPMTISSDRQTVLDFTQPYMTFGLAFMMRVQEVKVNYFRFLLPFNQSLWIAICMLVMVMGFFVWICSLFSPWGYYGRCVQVKPSKQVIDVHFISDVSLHGKVELKMEEYWPFLW